ncbi:MAG TPA: P-II family nitrogen regulator [Terriglobia bacterium]|nr:P-II family nitrogen regulator [Terriglobia bacterium]
MRPAQVSFEMVLPESQVEAAIDAILRSAKTGKIGDGKIFVSNVEDAIRIRNLDRGDKAI